jgi:hypothetical protein
MLRTVSSEHRMKNSSEHKSMWFGGVFFIHVFYHTRKNSFPYFKFELFDPWVSHLLQFSSQLKT